MEPYGDKKKLFEKKSQRAEQKLKVGPFSLVRFFMLRLKGKNERGTLCNNFDPGIRLVEQTEQKFYRI